MTAAEFAEYWQRQGCRVVETPLSFWHRTSAGLYLSLPHHRPIDPAAAELARVFIQGAGLAARYVTRSAGTVGPGVFLCRNRAYELESLHRKARNQTVRGLERCRVEQVDLAATAPDSFALHLRTLERQGRRNRGARWTEWKRRCEVAHQIGGFEGWAALVDGRLASFALCAHVEDCFTILDQSSDPELLHHQPNNALVFTVTRRKLQDPAVSAVSYGLQSLKATEGLDRFKVRMGFATDDVRQRVVINPVLAPLLRPMIVVAAHASRHWPASEFWMKAANAVSLAG